MMIIMHPGATKEQIDGVIAEVEKQKLTSHPIFGVKQTIIGALGDGHYVAKEIFEALPGVMEVQRISNTMSPSKARSFSADEYIHRVLPLFGGSPQERVVNLMTPEGRRLLNDAYDVVANKQIFTPQVIKELSHYLKGEIPSAEYAWRASPDLLNNTIEELFSRMQGPTTTSFNQALSQQLQQQGKRHVLYNPQRWNEYEMLALDPSYVMPLDYRKVRDYTFPASYYLENTLRLTGENPATPGMQKGLEQIQDLMQQNKSGLGDIYSERPWTERLNEENKRGLMELISPEFRDLIGNQLFP